MKICYLWVEKFRNLENFGVNLSSEYEFHYERSTHTITRSTKNKLPDDFFPKGISDVSAFIGENGSGKSNCIEFICMALKGGKSRIKSDFIIITEDSGFYTSHQKIANKKFAASNNFGATNEIYNRDINGINAVYFSNIRDDRILNFDKSVSNISNNNNGYKKTNINDQVKFINSDRFNILEIQEPEFIQMEIKYYTTGAVIACENSTKNNLAKFTNLLKWRIKELTTTSKFSISLKFAVIFKLINEMAKTDIKSIESLIENCLVFERNERIEFAANRIFEACTNHSKFNTLPNFAEYNLIISEIASSKVYFLDDGFSNSKSAIKFTLNYNNNSSKKFIEKLIKFFDEDYLVKFSWWGLSTGHAAYIRLFSSIYSELKRTKNDAILLIDEGDLFLHPKWQVEFFDKLMSVIPKLSRISIQVVLTSHSPFILSDLPSQCVTILKLGNNSQTAIKEKIASKTFGANLYELYSDIFFLGSMRTGCFADNKISALLREIDEINNVNALNSKIRDYSNIIGDRVINHILSEINPND